MSGYRQDMPPAEGYARVRIARLNKPKGLGNIALLGVVMVGMTYGFAKYIIAQRAENVKRAARAEERTRYQPKLVEYLQRREKEKEQRIWDEVEAMVQERRARIKKDRKIEE